MSAKGRRYSTVVRRFQDTYDYGEGVVDHEHEFEELSCGHVIENPDLYPHYYRRSKAEQVAALGRAVLEKGYKRACHGCAVVVRTNQQGEQNGKGN